MRHRHRHPSALSQPSVPANNAATQQATPSAAPTPVLTDNPTFTAKVPKDVKIKNLIMLEGKLSGISSAQDVSITCYYPNGQTYNKVVKDVENDGSADYFFETEEGGLGSGYITVSLVSIGEILVKYDFEVIPL